MVLAELVWALAGLVMVLAELGLVWVVLVESEY
jgi:hypothetical protein